MKKVILLGFLLVFMVSLAWGQNTWINEIHYDNSGTDANEGLEVIIENPGSYTLSNFTITLYNGNGGSTYGAHTLDTFIVGDSDGNFTYYYKMIANIQNGSPDGISLDHDGSLIQFLSYEGQFVGTNGVANGVTSTDIGVSEGTTTASQSMQLTGNGTQYSDFTWITNLDQTWGTPNNGDQELPVTLSSFTVAQFENDMASIMWETASESNMSYFKIYRDEMEIHTVSATNTSETHSYTVQDQDLVAGTTYHYYLEALEYDGDTETFGPIILTVNSDQEELPSVDIYETGLHGNFPNPFNPTTTIKFSIHNEESGILEIFTAKGELVETREFGAGDHTFQWDANGNASGIYFYKLKTDSYSRTKKMVLLK